METKMTTRTTTTDLGKIVLMSGGEYSPDKTYEERTFVLYQNSTYVALQTVTGIEPSNDLVNWQLMAKGFAGSETQIEGYVFVDNEEVIAPAADPALDADKLGGNLPDYYAPQHEISDSFSETKSYAVGDYCIYLNALYRFTNAKAAGAWDGSAVVPVTLAQEIAANRGGIEAINNNLKIGSITGQTYYTGSDGADANKINRYFVLCKGANLPDSNSFWFLQTIIFQIGADGFVEHGKQIAYKYDGSQIYERHKAYDQNWTAWNGYATKGDLNSIIISKTYENVVSDNVGQKVLPDVPSGYRIISAVTEHYRYGCFVSGSHSIRFYVITDTGSPVQATNETIGKLTVTFAKNL